MFQISEVVCKKMFTNPNSGYTVLAHNRSHLVPLENSSPFLTNFNLAVARTLRPKQTGKSLSRKEKDSHVAPNEI